MKQKKKSHSSYEAKGLVLLLNLLALTTTALFFTHQQNFLFFSVSIFFCRVLYMLWFSNFVSFVYCRLLVSLPLIFFDGTQKKKKKKTTKTPITKKETIAVILDVNSLHTKKRKKSYTLYTGSMLRTLAEGTN